MLLLLLPPLLLRLLLLQLLILHLPLLLEQMLWQLLLRTFAAMYLVAAAVAAALRLTIIFLPPFTCFDEFPPSRVDMLEAWEDPQSQVELFQYSDFPFNLEIVEQDNLPAEISARNIEDIINTVVGLVPEGKVANWVVGII